ncbi:unnamed protein product [Prorocentrum cordatum]|uniref:Secreted protein n=1 Tax=Prorocentrum cordatum TaxID=2364126 RepID=A0ABN9UAA3_9DINO|nr:unnamed protein product [Polarella glacialis]
MSLPSSPADDDDDDDAHCLPVALLLSFAALCRTGRALVGSPGGSPVVLDFSTGVSAARTRVFSTRFVLAISPRDLSLCLCLSRFVSVCSLSLSLSFSLSLSLFFALFVF